MASSILFGGTRVGWDDNAFYRGLREETLRMQFRLLTNARQDVLKAMCAKLPRLLIAMILSYVLQHEDQPVLLSVSREPPVSDKLKTDHDSWVADIAKAYSALLEYDFDDGMHSIAFTTYWHVNTFAIVYDALDYDNALCPSRELFDHQVALCIRKLDITFDMYMYDIDPVEVSIEEMSLIVATIHRIMASAKDLLTFTLGLDLYGYVDDEDEPAPTELASLNILLVRKLLPTLTNLHPNEVALRVNFERKKGCRNWKDRLREGRQLLQDATGELDERSAAELVLWDGKYRNKADVLVKRTRRIDWVRETFKL